MACSARRENNTLECCMCKRLPNEDVVFYSCPSKHLYCLVCAQGLKSFCKGVLGQSTCTICRFTGEFAQFCFNTPSVNKAPHKTDLNGNNGYKQLSAYTTVTPRTDLDDDKTFETLIGIPKEHFRQLQLEHSKEAFKDYRQKSEKPPPEPVTNGFLFKKTSACYLNSVRSKYNLLPSRKPIKCPHKPCHKTVATSQFVNHFKSEHCNIPMISLERGREVCLPFDVTVVEHGCHFCLSMITLYEINRIDFIGSRSSESVIRTASKFCQKLPINTFWLMVTGSNKKTEESTYCFFWLFTNSEESYNCTIELGSTTDSACLSTYCSVNNSLGNEEFLEVAERLNCLLATNLSVRSLLKEGIVLNLRVTIH